MRVGFVVCGVWLAGCRLGFDVPSDATRDAPSVAVPLVSDDFEDGVLDPMWYFYNAAPPETHFVETAGELQFKIATNIVSYAGLTSPVSDLRGKALWIETAAPLPAMDGAIAYMDWGGMGKLVRINGFGDFVMVVVDGVEVVRKTKPYPEARWWRLRDDGGDIVAEIAADGRTWTELHRVPNAPYISAGGLNIGCGAFFAHAGGEQWRLASVGIAPP